MTIDITAILGGFTKSVDASNQNIAEAGERVAAQREALLRTDAQMTLEGAAAAELAADAARKKAAINYSIRAQGEKAQAIADLNPNAAENAFTRTMATLTDARMQREAAMAQYRNITERNFFDDPFQYLVGQLNLPQVVARHNNAAMAEDAAADELQTRQTLLAQNKQAVVANTADEMRALELQEAETKAHVANIELLKTRQDNAAKLAGLDMQAAQLADKRGDNERALFGAKLQAAQYLETLAERREARAERAANAATRLSAQREKELQESYMLANINQASASLGRNTFSSLKDFQALPNSPQKQMLANVAARGAYGDSFGESFQTVVSLANLPAIARQDATFARGVQDMGLTVQAIANRLEKEATKTGKTMKPAELATAALQQYEAEIRAAMEDPKSTRGALASYWDSHFNPQRPNYSHAVEQAMAGTGSIPKTNVFVQALQTAKVTVPPGARDYRGEDVNRAIVTVAQLVADRKVLPAQAAADITQFHAAAVAQSQAQNRLALLGLQPSKSMHVTVEPAGFFAGAIAGDLLSPASVENMITKLAVRQTHRNYAPVFDAFGVQIPE